MNCRKRPILCSAGKAAEAVFLTWTLYSGGLPRWTFWILTQNGTSGFTVCKHSAPLPFQVTGQSLSKQQFSWWILFACKTGRFSDVRFIALLLRHYLHSRVFYPPFFVSSPGYASDKRLIRVSFLNCHRQVVRFQRRFIQAQKGFPNREVVSVFVSRNVSKSSG